MSHYSGDRKTQIQERNRETNRKWMRLFTTLSLTHSNGYVLFSDDNALPSPDHLHNWYPFWDANLGPPVGDGQLHPDGSWWREFSNGTAIYNPPAGFALTVGFDEPRKSAATGRVAKKHHIPPGDGDLFLIQS